LGKLRRFERHYLRKENILFPYLEKHGFTGPTAVMWGIHDDIRAAWKELDGALTDPGEGLASCSVAEARERVDDMTTAMREMFYKEENILFPTALRLLDQQEWLSIRDQEEDVGFFLVTPGTQWPAVEVVEQGVEQTPPALQPDPGLLSLSTGLLSLEQVNLMLRHLPVDVTYVDEDDQVAFYSETRERLFPRSPAIIGREVQKCHPPASMHRVQEILDAFREGSRDEASFWIQMNERFIHIRYFALRDANQTYQGTLEVTQDVTEIRGLEGEQRLLDDRG
jgi:DUF438 domain-containing protein